MEGSIIGSERLEPEFEHHQMNRSTTTKRRFEPTGDELVVDSLYEQPPKKEMAAENGQTGVVKNETSTVEDNIVETFEVVANEVAEVYDGNGGGEVYSGGDGVVAERVANELVVFEVGKTARKSPCLWHQGFRFIHNSRNYWRCANYTKGCRATAQTISNEELGDEQQSDNIQRGLLQKVEHNHPPYPEQQKAEQRIAEIHQLINQNPLVRPQEILTEVRNRNIDPESSLEMGKERKTIIVGGANSNVDPIEEGSEVNEAPAAPLFKKQKLKSKPAKAQRPIKREYPMGKATSSSSSMLMATQMQMATIRNQRRLTELEIRRKEQQLRLGALQLQAEEMSIWQMHLQIYKLENELGVAHRYIDIDTEMEDDDEFDEMDV